MYADDVLRDMERQFGCEIKTYLSREDVDEDARFHLKNEENIGSPDSEEEPDYTIEKFIFFEAFVKQLEVLDAMHTACMMCQELIEVSSFKDNHLF